MLPIVKAPMVIEKAVKFLVYSTQWTVKFESTILDMIQRGKLHWFGILKRILEKRLHYVNLKAGWKTGKLKHREWEASMTWWENTTHGRRYARQESEKRGSERRRQIKTNTVDGNQIYDIAKARHTACFWYRNEVNAKSRPHSFAGYTDIYIKTSSRVFFFSLFL